MKNVTPTEALNSLHPILCAFVISVDKADKPNGMIASWFSQVSFEPPLVAVAVGKSRNTHKLITGSKEFVIAVPNKAMQKEVLYFGNTTGSEVDKFAETKIKTKKSKFLKVPILADATINYECKLVEVIDTGDHSIFIGVVVASWLDEDKKVLMNFGKKSDKRLFEEF